MASEAWLDYNERSLDVANTRWANAVRIYRHSLDLYHQAVAMRVQREAGLLRRQFALATPAPALADQAAASASALAELTPREREVACLIANGCSNQQIAEKLVLTRGTVANHVAHILYKLGVTNRTQVAALVHQYPSERA